jgi:hypothetical protein
LKSQLFKENQFHFINPAVEVQDSGVHLRSNLKLFHDFKTTKRLVLAYITSDNLPFGGLAIQ